MLWKAMHTGFNCPLKIAFSIYCIAAICTLAGCHKSDTTNQLRLLSISCTDGSSFHFKYGNDGFLISITSNPPTHPAFPCDQGDVYCKKSITNFIYEKEILVKSEFYVVDVQSGNRFLFWSQIYGYSGDSSKSAQFDWNNNYQDSIFFITRSGQSIPRSYYDKNLQLEFLFEEQPNEIRSTMNLTGVPPEIIRWDKSVVKNPLLLATKGNPFITSIYWFAPWHVHQTVSWSWRYNLSESYPNNLEPYGVDFEYSRRPDNYPSTAIINLGGRRDTLIYKYSDGK